MPTKKETDNDQTTTVPKSSSAATTKTVRQNDDNPQLEESTVITPHRVLALYKFVKPQIPKESLNSLQSEIETACHNHHAKGTLLLAEEGINGTISYPFSPSNNNNNNNNNNDSDENNDNDDDDSLLTFLQSKFDNALRIRISSSDRAVFARLKVRIKKEIVTMHWQETEETNDNCPTASSGCTSCNPTEQVGEYVKPHDWNRLILDPDTLLIDTRNEYEIDVGTFRNAINPHTQSFVEFPDWMKDNLLLDKCDTDNNNNNNNDRHKVPKRIAMFCTGGIRCEKATSAGLQLVPKDVPVYHLEGGILAYLNDIQPDQSLFEGDCYVFDQRVAVTYGLQPSTIYQQSCHGCRHPLSNDDLKRDDFVKGVSCRYCSNSLTERKVERYAARQRQIELALLGKETCHDIFLQNR
ncbi:hypothetical protein IV203_010803 [Nitzschia inconspicua]|uniref:Rhodanese domain-containing protein n=1 Tax=Nitzschia inconspicua TaxID=303405 RepID=A0A9K3KX45_9STRA|nr:hypothetical protein IV203_010803 [Nitzschia inconspicua]